LVRFSSTENDAKGAEKYYDDKEYFERLSAKLANDKDLKMLKRKNN